MRRRLATGLILLNGLMAWAVLARPAETQIPPLGILDCCEDDGEIPYCCFNCCWFIANCDGHEDCQVTAYLSSKGDQRK